MFDPQNWMDKLTHVSALVNKAFLQDSKITPFPAWLNI
jgi:hypothetical protein